MSHVRADEKALAPRQTSRYTSDDLVLGFLLFLSLLCIGDSFVEQGQVLTVIDRLSGQVPSLVSAESPPVTWAEPAKH
jgi:hypothetical protein